MPSVLPKLVVTGEEDAALIVNADTDKKITHIVSISDGAHPCPFDSGDRKFLRLEFSDVGQQGMQWALDNGYDIPSEEHIKSMVKFARSITQESKLLVHCWQGISRSTATAIIMLLSINDKFYLKRVVGYVLDSCLTGSPSPNSRIIALGELKLGFEKHEVKNTIKRMKSRYKINPPFVNWN